jgi:dUTP pyrophosphatase
MIVKIKTLSENAKVPEYATAGSAGVDLSSAVSLTIEPGKIALVKTNISIEMPANIEAQIRSRSGLAIKNGIFVLNAPGTIDSDYRGDIGVILANFGENTFVVNVGDRIAQMVFAKVIKPNFSMSTELSETIRGDGGFGHTGV